MKISNTQGNQIWISYIHVYNDVPDTHNGGDVWLIIHENNLSDTSVNAPNNRASAKDLFMSNHSEIDNDQ